MANEAFSEEFLSFLNPENSPQQAKVIKYEICAGEGCNELRLIDGSEGCESIGPFTYCADCYTKVSKVESVDDRNKSESGGIITIPTIEIIADKLNNDGELLKKDYRQQNEQCSDTDVF